MKFSICITSEYTHLWDTTHAHFRSLIRVVRPLFLFRTDIIGRIHRFGRSVCSNVRSAFCAKQRVDAATIVSTFAKVSNRRSTKAIQRAGAHGSIVDLVFRKTNFLSFFSFSLNNHLELVFFSNSIAFHKIVMMKHLVGYGIEFFIWNRKTSLIDHNSLVITK